MTNSFRDFGAQVNTTSQHLTTLSFERLKKAFRIVYRIGNHPHHAMKKARFLLGCAHPMAMYGVEHGPYNIAALASFDVAIARSLGSWLQNRFIPLVMNFGTSTSTLEPSTYVFVQRVF